MQNKKTFFSTGEASRLLGIQPYRLAYAHAIGKVREPGRLFGRRAYRWADLAALAKHFDVQLFNPAINGPEGESL